MPNKPDPRAFITCSRFPARLDQHGKATFRHVSVKPSVHCSSSKSPCSMSHGQSNLQHMGSFMRSFPHSQPLTAIPASHLNVHAECCSFDFLGQAVQHIGHQPSIAPQAVAQAVPADQNAGKWQVRGRGSACHWESCAHHLYHQPAHCWLTHDNICKLYTTSNERTGALPTFPQRHAP